jgi:hypothetical protein
MATELGQKIYNYFQEPEENFETIVQKKHWSNDPGFQVEKYFFVETRTSGKRTKSHLRRFYENIFGEDTVYSWASQKYSETMELAQPTKNVMSLIPERTTNV